MTVTDQSTHEMTSPAFRLVVVDVYKDIHKGIRSELFAVTEQAGRVDPADAVGRADVAAHVRSVVDLLVDHAHHEDTHVQPAIDANLPDLAERIEGDHVRLEAWMDDLQAMADEAASATSDQRLLGHRLYLELARFTSSYLDHQDVEERIVMPALEDALGVPAVGAIHGAIVGSIPPEKMAASLAIMLPAMNVDDRAELLGGMQANAPAEVFGGVWSLAGSVLEPADHLALGRRLGLS